MSYQDLIYEINYWGSLFHPYIKAVFCLSCCCMIKIDLSIESSTLHLPPTGELSRSTYYITKILQTTKPLTSNIHISTLCTACRFHAILYSIYRKAQTLWCHGDWKKRENTGLQKVTEGKTTAVVIVRNWQTMKGYARTDLSFQSKMTDSNRHTHTLCYCWVFDVDSTSSSLSMRLLVFSLHSHHVSSLSCLCSRVVCGWWEWSGHMDMRNWCLAWGEL